MFTSAKGVFSIPVSTPREVVGSRPTLQEVDNPTQLRAARTVLLGCRVLRREPMGSHIPPRYDTWSKGVLEYPPDHDLTGNL